MKTKNKIIVLFASIAITCFFLSCEQNALDAEQYFKQVYLVGGVDNMQEKEVHYSSEIQETYVSVAVGGSKLIDKDLMVTIGEADISNIINYNAKYKIQGDILFQPLLKEAYNIPSYSAVIKAGQVYSRIPIRINTQLLNCDSLYTLPLKIINVSDYKIREIDTVLLLTPKLINNYSGLYMMQSSRVQIKDGKEVGNISVINASRTLTAVNEFTVRLFNNAELEKRENLDNYALTFIINPNDNSVQIRGWKNLNILNGGGVYDPNLKAFNVWYNYIDSGNEYRVTATLKI